MWLNLQLGWLKATIVLMFWLKATEASVPKGGAFNYFPCQKSQGYRVATRQAYMPVIRFTVSTTNLSVPVRPIRA